MNSLDKLSGWEYYIDKYKAQAGNIQMRNFNIFAGEYYYFSFYFFTNKSRADLPCENEKK